MQAVVHVVIVIGDVVRERRDLRLRRRKRVEPQILPRVVGHDRAPGRVAQLRRHRPVVLDHPFQGLPGQVQSVKGGVAPLQPRDHAEGLHVVIKARVFGHATMQLILARMTERRMAEVVRQGHRLGEIGVQTQRLGQGPRDLRHLKAMGQAGAVIVALMRHKDLGLLLQASEGAGVDDPVPVPGEGRPDAAFRLGMPTTAALRRIAGVRGSGEGPHVNDSGRRRGTGQAEVSEPWAFRSARNMRI